MCKERDRKIPEKKCQKRIKKGRSGARGVNIDWEHPLCCAFQVILRLAAPEKREKKQSEADSQFLSRSPVFASIITAGFK